ncbi:hypothetical protein [Phaffia rhodozyma]|uniref:Uncharacterized protein n=1 Tax=Phaffia rhodozyma TaxID=264483 RepID=A0A0F7SQ39_PHARH|nr:hypothetical protein [Phaffia rhodozyma]
MSFVYRPIQKAFHEYPVYSWCCAIFLVGPTYYFGNRTYKRVNNIPRIEDIPYAYPDLKRARVPVPSKYDD